MLTNIQEKFFKKIESFERTQQLYIIPTFDGLKLAGLNFILLIVGLIYGNNYVLFFDFVLFCLFLGSMYYTHFNLQGLKLISINSLSLHKNEQGVLNLAFQTNSSFGHNFIELELVSTHSITSISPTSFSFNPKNKTDKILNVSLPIMALQRGHIVQLKLKIETFFPFHLFRCFTYFKIESDLFVFPEVKDLNLYHEIIISESVFDDNEHLVIEQFRKGESLKRIHWKKLAQTNQLYSKKMNQLSTKPVLLSLNDSLANSKLNEDQLSSLTYGLYYYNNNIDFGLDIPGLFIKPELSSRQLQKCLIALANYEI